MIFEIKKFPILIRPPLSIAKHSNNWYQIKVPSKTVQPLEGKSLRKLDNYTDMDRQEGLSKNRLIYLWIELYFQEHKNENIFDGSRV